MRGRTQPDETRCCQPLVDQAVEQACVRSKASDWWGTMAKGDVVDSDAKEEVEVFRRNSGTKM